MNKQYALAFFDIAKEDNVLDSAKDSFTMFITLLKNEEDLLNVLSSPNIKVSKKKDLIKDIFKDFELDFILFLNVLLDNGRMSLIFDIYKEFLYLYNEHNKIKEVDVYSVNDLTKEEEEKLLNSLKHHFEGYKVVIVSKIDLSIVAGYRINVNGSSIDLSLKRKIENLFNHVIN